MIGGERERRSSAPGSLIVRRFGIAPTDNENIPRSPHFVKVLEQKIGKIRPNVVRIHTTSGTIKPFSAADVVATINSLDFKES